MTEEDTGRWVQSLIDKDRLDLFYSSPAWRKTRREVLEGYKSECQHCKAKGYYTRANTVHHVQYVRRHPRLALSKTYAFKGIEYINLIPLCEECHKVTHGRDRKRAKPLTVERWE
ncbi:MAG TPA: HNH endonuclease [Epulopiscium sp.]|nr:HNH endonuclease [Candidatus Epulonipiscium sp.]